MTLEVPPPVPPPRAPRRVRPDVPVLATLATLFVGAGMLASGCAGGAVVAVARRAKPRLEETAARRDEQAHARERLGDARSSLDAVAARLEATARGTGELPEALDEAPPKDPWG